MQLNLQPFVDIREMDLCVKSRGLGAAFALLASAFAMRRLMRRRHVPGFRALVTTPILAAEPPLARPSPERFQRPQPAAKSTALIRPAMAR